MIAFQCKDFKTYAIGEGIKKYHNWYYGQLQLPHAIHMCVTNANTQKMPTFIKDIGAAFEDINEDANLLKTDVGTLYGATTKITDKKLLAQVYMDMLDSGLGVNIEWAFYGLYEEGDIIFSKSSILGKNHKKEERKDE